MPAASESHESPLPPLPLRLRPLGVRVASWGFSVALLVTLAAIWFAFPDGIREQFTGFQKATVLGMLFVTLVIGHALSRCRVDADAEGLTVVNGYRAHRLEWGQVVAVSLRPGNPWALLDLTDGTTRSAMGIQGSDGARAQRQVRQLRALVDAHAASDPRG